MRHVTHTFSKRAGALFLCLALLAGLLPTAAWAANGDEGPTNSSNPTSPGGAATPAPTSDPDEGGTPED